MDLEREDSWWTEKGDEMGDMWTWVLQCGEGMRVKWACRTEKIVCRSEAQ